MTVPLEFFPGLSVTNLIIFNIIQTLINFFLFIFLLYGYLYLLKKSRNEVDKKKIIITGLILEFFHFINSILWNFFILFVLVGIIAQFLFYLMIPACVIYLKYYSKSEFNELKVFLLYMVVFIPALLLSMFLTSILLNFSGIANYFVFTF